MKPMKTIGGMQVNELAVHSAYHQVVHEQAARDFFLAVGHEYFRQESTGRTLMPITRTITLIDGKPVESFLFNGYMLTKFTPHKVTGWRGRLMAWLLK